MATIPTVVQNEPVITAAVLSTLVSNAVAIAVALGLDLSADLQTAILGFVNTALPVAFALVARSKVTPVNKV